MEATWIKWWNSKDAWTIIGAGLLAMAIAFCAAYFLYWPWNLIGAIIPCIPAGIIIRKTLTNIFIKILSNNKTTEEP